MTSWLRWFKMVFLLACTAMTPAAWPADEEAIKVVYHMSEGIPQASRAINNIRNTWLLTPPPKLWW